MPDTETLELPLPELDDGAAYPDPEPAAVYDTEPTTITMPIAGSAESVVLDEPDAGQRSLESLTISAVRARVVLAILAVGAFAAGVAETSVVALSPAIASGLNVQVASIGFLVTVFSLTVVVSSMPLTLATSRWSRRAVLPAIFGVWAAGSVVVATSTTLAQFAGGRVLSALAHALFWAVVAPAAASLFAPHMRGRVVTRVMLGAAAAGVVGTPLVTLAGQQVSWQLPYWVLGALNLAIGVALALSLPASPRRDRSAPRQITRGDVPSLPEFIRVLVVTFTVTAGMALSWTYIVPLFTTTSGLDEAIVPALFAAGGVVAMVATLGVGRYLASFAVQTVMVGLGVLAIAWGMLALAMPWAAVTAQLLQAGGWAILVAALLNWAMRHTPWSTDVGGSTYSIVVNAGAAIGAVLGGVLTATWGLRSLPLASLGFTLLALAVTASVDRHMLRRLQVPRAVRAALESRERMRERRREWRARTRPAALRPRGRATSFSFGAERARRAIERSTKRTSAAAAREASKAMRRADAAAKKADASARKAVKAAAKNASPRKSGGAKRR